LQKSAEIVLTLQPCKSQECQLPDIASSFQDPAAGDKEKDTPPKQKRVLFYKTDTN
jgi:hypothetical protein